jgi:1,4-alpha-glucan branching enzyme
VSFLQNHDQVGNRALGERLHALASPGALRSMLAIFLLAPSIPLLFMGEEFGADAPFLFFADFEGDLAQAVSDGRRAEFSLAGADVPDPCAESTFERSRLDWDTVVQEPHAAWVRLYRALLAARREHIVPLITSIVAGGARFHAGAHALDVAWPLADKRTLRLAVRLQADPLPPSTGTTILQSNDAWAVRWTIDDA